MVTSLVSLHQVYVKKSERLVKIAKIEEATLMNNFLMKFSREMRLVIIFKVTKNQDLTLSWKTQGGSN